MGLAMEVISNRGKKKKENGAVEGERDVLCDGKSKSETETRRSKLARKNNTNSQRELTRRKEKKRKEDRDLRKDLY